MRAHNDAEREQGRADTWLVGLVWLATTIVLWNFSARYVSVLPFTDDVAMAPVLASDQPFRWELLWAHHNEHRIPLVKALYLALVFGLHDLRAGAWCQAATLPLASLGLLFALRRRRGHLELTDAVLPLLLHEIGNAENLLNSFQLSFALPALIVCALLALAIGWQRAPRWPGIATLWVLILMLAGCGGVGLPLAAALAAWPVYLGWRARREQASGWGASFAVALAGSGLLVCALAMYASSLELQPGFQAAGLALSLRTAAQFLSTGIGVTAGLFGIWPALLVLFVLGVAGAWLVRSCLRSATRPLALPLASVFVGSLLLAGLIGWGRGNDDPNAGLTNRYVILAAVPLCAAQLALRLVASGTLARFTRLVLFAIVLASAARNYEFGTQVGSERAELTERVLAEMRAGAGADEIAHEHFASFFYAESDFAGDLRDLQQAGLLDVLHPGERLPADGDPYVALGARPTRVEAELPAEVRRIDDRYALLVRGPARVEYEIPPGARRAQGRAAFLGHARAHARLVLEAGRATLEQAQLASPGLRESPDWKVFDLELPAERPAALRLRFEGPSGWVLVAGLRFL